MRSWSQQITEASNAIRKFGGENVFSNYFFNPLNNLDEPPKFADGSLVFLSREHDFQRIHFVSRMLTSLQTILSELPNERLVADFVTNKDDFQHVDETFERAGFKKIAVYKRLQKPQLAARTAPRHSSFAVESECNELMYSLLREFDTRKDHIPARDELVDLVRQKQVLVHRNNGAICGYVIYRLQGRKCNVNYWYSHPGNDPLVAIRLLTALYAVVAQQGIRSAYLWVDEEKTGVARVHQGFGFQYDGLQTHIYSRSGQQRHESANIPPSMKCA